MYSNPGTLQQRCDTLTVENAYFKDNIKAAAKKLIVVDSYLDSLWGKGDDKKLSAMVSELRDAMNALNETSKPWQ